jgi:hypothetical protein
MASKPSACVREASFEHAMGAGNAATELAIRRKDSLLRALEDSTPTANAKTSVVSLLRPRCD